jgi:putative tryptophan/tyrosine transport system substrate-binding protein
MMQRRPLMIALAGAACATSLAAEAQPATVRRIGFIVPRASSGDPDRAAGVAAFHDAMRELGWLAGRDYRLEEHSVEGRNERYAQIAAELVGSRVSLLLVPGTSAALAAQKATAMIPVVFLSVSDPVGSGLVASLARPGANVTGRSTITIELDPKRLELLREAVPGLASVTLLIASLAAASGAPSVLGRALASVEAAGRQLGIRVQPVWLPDAQALDATLAQIHARAAGGLIVFDQAIVLRHRERILNFALRERLPAIYQSGGWVRAGGLMSYGPNNTDEMRRIATYVDKIFKGAKPSELPVEQPTLIELVMNLKTARALGLTIPQALLLRADEVIQ